MRRSITLYILGGFIPLFIAVCVVLVYGGGAARYHQHRENPGEAELGDCGVCAKTRFCTHLPVISVDTGGAKIPGRPIVSDEDTAAFMLGYALSDYAMQISGYELSDDGTEEIPVSLYTVDNPGWNHQADAPAHSSAALFRIRGNSSRFFDKPGYRIKLTGDSASQENPLPLLGMTQSDEWVLHGPFLDKTLMRNYVWMNLSAEIAGYAPNVRFCELFLDGVYQGVYLLMETVEVREGKVDITRYKDGDPVTSYLTRIDQAYRMAETNIGSFSFYTHRLELFTAAELLYPGGYRQNENVRGYVAADISETEKTLYSLELTHNARAYEKLINIDSFADYYIIMEFLAVNDTFQRSTYFYKDVRGKLTIGPVWDFNNVLNNFFHNIPTNEFILSQRGYFGRLMMDERFVNRVITRWRELRRGILSDRNLLRYHTEVELWLGGAVPRNYEKWGYSFDPQLLGGDSRRGLRESEQELTIYDVNPSGYAEAMEWMLEYMTDRARFIDEHIDSLRQYCHPSRRAMWAVD